VVWSLQGRFSSNKLVQTLAMSNRVKRKSSNYPAVPKVSKDVFRGSQTVVWSRRGCLYSEQCQIGLKKMSSNYLAVPKDVFRGSQTEVWSRRGCLYSEQCQIVLTKSCQIIQPSQRMSSEDPRQWSGLREAVFILNSVK
jgi:hypothetical protein